MRPFFFTCFIFLLLSLNLSAQVWKGRVVCAETDEPIPYANVFLRGSLIGTITNPEGKFELDPKGNTALSLVVSGMGFQSVLVEPDNLGKSLKVQLETRRYDIEEVDVKAESSAWSRRRMIKRFKYEFLGSSQIAKSCEILNIDAIYLFYNKATKTLYASCKSPIEIRNKALGYKVNYFLDEFRWTRKTMKFKGFSSFEELQFLDEKERDKINKRRYFTYRGTPMNFFRCLYQEDLEGSRFDVYTKSMQTLGPNEMIDRANNSKKLCVDESIVVRYSTNLRSEILFNVPCINLNANGLVNPDEVSFLGVMAIYRVGDMLPYDYVPIK